MFKFIKGLINTKKKKWFLLAILVVLIIASYFSYQQFFNQSDVQASYKTTVVEKGNIVSSISGTGQVSASNQVDLQSKISGDVVTVNVVVGQEIKEGDVLFQIDSRDASMSVREAQVALENAQLDLQDLLSPADDYALLQAKNSLASAKDSLENLKYSQEREYQNAFDDKDEAEQNLEKSYEDSYNDIANAFLDFPDIITGLYNTMFSFELYQNENTSNTFNVYVLVNTILNSHYQDKEDLKNFIDRANDDYKIAKDHYDELFTTYSNLSRYSDEQEITDFLDEMIALSREISDAVKSATNIFDFWVGYRHRNNLLIFSDVTSYQSDLSSYTSKTNSHLSSFLSVQSSIDSDQKTIINSDKDIVEMERTQPMDLAAAERNIEEKTQNLADLITGPTELEIKSKQLAINQKQNSLWNAQNDLADCYVKAPFDGVVADVGFSRGDTVGSSSILATLITTSRIAEISLNEIDVASIEIGQKVIITFDAIEGLSISGKVIEIDAIGKNSSGVVSYGVKIGFDTQDERIKPGMTISTNIITNSKQNILSVPLSAVKTINNIDYIEILVDGNSQQIIVTTGVSDDTMIEISEGLSEGDQVITQTISGTAVSSTNSSNSDTDAMRGMMQLNGGGGGFPR